MAQTITSKGRRPKYQDFAQAQIDADAARLRAEGKSYREIALAQRCDVKTAHVRVQRAIAAVPVDAVEAMRVVWGERLEEAYREARAQLHAEHVRVDHGRIVRDEDGTPLLDAAPRLHAARTIVTLADRAARLFGLDSPVKVNAEVTVHDGDSELDRQIEQLLASMGPVEQGPPALEAPSTNGANHS